MIIRKIQNSNSLLVKFNFKTYNSIFAYVYLIPFNLYKFIVLPQQPKFVKRYLPSLTKLFNSFYNNRFTLITSVIMTAIPTARQSKTNWMNTHLKHCSRLNDKSFDTILIGDSLIAGLARYSKVWNKFFKPLNAFNCGIGGDRVEHVLWRAHDLRCFSSLRNVIILCGTNNLYQVLPEDIANGLVKIASCFKQGNNAINVFICGILPRDDTSSINRLLIK